MKENLFLLENVMDITLRIVSAARLRADVSKEIKSSFRLNPHVQTTSRATLFITLYMSSVFSVFFVSIAPLFEKFNFNVDN